MVKEGLAAGAVFFVLFLFSIFQIMRLQGGDAVFSSLNILGVLALGICAVYLYESLRG